MTDEQTPEEQLGACRKKCGSLIKHLIKARELGFYDFENVDYGVDK
jgi:hypothetical protein